MEQRFLYKSCFVFCILMRPAVGFSKSKTFLQLFVTKNFSFLYPNLGFTPFRVYTLIGTFLQPDQVAGKSNSSYNSIENKLRYSPICDCGKPLLTAEMNVVLQFCLAQYLVKENTSVFFEFCLSSLTFTDCRRTGGQLDSGSIQRRSFHHNS